MKPDTIVDLGLPAALDLRAMERKVHAALLDITLADAVVAPLQACMRKSHQYSPAHQHRANFPSNRKSTRDTSDERGL
jgi:hypothetical protein